MNPRPMLTIEQVKRIIQRFKEIEHENYAVDHEILAKMMGSITKKEV